MPPKRSNLSPTSKGARSKSRDRAQETPEQQQQRLAIQRATNQARRAQETPEQQQQRLAIDRASHQTKREQETPEQRQQRLAQDALSHQRDPVQDQQQHLVSKCYTPPLTPSPAFASGSLRTLEKRSVPQGPQMVISAVPSLSAPPGGNRPRVPALVASAPDLFLHLAPPPPVHNQAGPVQIVVGQALNYMPNVQYDKHKNIVIGKMEHTCSHCQASKWAGEAPGLCCSWGKVVLPLLAPPPEPLK